MFDFPAIYEEIVARAGGEQSTAEDLFKVERGVTLILTRWMNKRYPTWRVSQTRVTASGHSPAIVLPPEIDDVLQVGNLQRITGARYMQIHDKMQQGTPGQFWLNRGEPPELRIYPIGRKGAPQALDVWYVATPPGWERGTPGTDVVPQRWLEALIIAGAHDLASKRPLEGGGYDEALIARLKGERDEAEEIALNTDRDRARFQYRIG